MNHEASSERSKASWNIYSSSEPSPSQIEANSNNNQSGPWKNLGTSMNAISFGFVATAILISMFLIMAIFEHLFKPSESYSSSSSSRDGNNRAADSRQMQKLGDPETVPVSYASTDFSVVMPGENYPTFIAQPSPLPCQREGAYWPSHEHNFSSPSPR